MSDVTLPKVLLIGFGNPGRLDDGLGPALVVALEKLKLPNLCVDSDYQLTVEDAADVAAFDIVIFADASVNGPEPFSFTQVEARASVSFSSHSVDAQTVLGLAHDMFQAKTLGFMLGIRGYDFNEFKEVLSDKAKQNLFAAYEFIVDVVKKGSFQQFYKDGVSS